jgi:hypothetical protein
VSIETLVRTWDGDGLDAFLSSLAEDFRAGPERAPDDPWNAT